MTRFAYLKWSTVVLLRVMADVIVVTASLMVAFLLRFLLAVWTLSVGDPVEFMQRYAHYLVLWGPLLTVILVGIFAITGIYTKKRFYTRRHKVLALAQAISVSYGLLLLGAYFFAYPDHLTFPRSVFLVSYALTMVGCIGMRGIKEYVEHHFTIQSNKPASKRRIRKVLVIGGAGYIGSVLVRDLLDSQYEVRVLDQLLFSDESIRDLNDHPGFELIRGDFRHVDMVVKAVKGVDAVIHLGAIVGDPACAVDEEITVQTNYAATALVAEVCKGSGVSRMLFASTCSVYGTTEHLVDEKSELNPVSLYATTKIDSEKILLTARDDYFHPTVLRLGTAYGWSHRPRFDLVVNLLTAKAYFDKKIVIYNGEQWRPFVHIKDISRAFVVMLDAPLSVVSGEIFNVGSYEMTLSLADVGETIRQIVSSVDMVAETNSDVRNYRVSFDKIHTVLGFTSQVSLLDGIREICEALNVGRVTDYADPVYHNHKFFTENGDALRMQPGPRPLAGQVDQPANAI